MTEPRGAWWDTEPDVEIEPELEPMREHRSEPDPSYGIERCSCGRLRLTYGGEVAGLCPHARLEP